MLFFFLPFAKNSSFNMKEEMIMGTIFALAFGYFSIAYYAYKAIKLLHEN